MPTITLAGGSTISTVQKNLQQHNTNQTTSISKITSGQRVFRAAEDPTAVVSNVGMKTELAALNRARLNTSTGVSMLQVADTAIGTLSDIASRMKTLASQAASGQLNDSDRALINLEFQSLKVEFDRIAQDTEFNDVKLLTGTANYIETEAASLAADGISSIQLDQTLLGDTPALRYTYDSSTETLSVTRIDGATSSTESIDLTLLLNANAGDNNNLTMGQTVNINFNTIGATLTLDSSFDRTVNILPTITDNSGADTTITLPATNSFEPATTDITEEAVTNLVALASGYNTTTGDLTLAVQTNGTNVTLGGIPGLHFDVGGTLTAVGADSADMVSGAASYVDIYINTTGGDVLLGRVNYDSLTTSGTTDGTLTLNIGQGLTQATYEDDSGAKQLTYVIGNGVNNTQDQVRISVQSATLSSMGLTNTALVTAAGSNAAIQDVDNALQLLSQLRANIGAQQSRLSFIAQNITSTIENTTIAQSDLMDVDISEEITSLTNSQAMFEASLNMMARINQQPQKLLQLLQDS